jgi:hypothetical protein
MKFMLGGECKHPTKKNAKIDPTISVDSWNGSDTVFAIDLWIGSDSVFGDDSWVNNGCVR